MAATFCPVVYASALLETTDIGRLRSDGPRLLEELARRGNLAGWTQALMAHGWMRFMAGAPMREFKASQAALDVRWHGLGRLPLHDFWFAGITASHLHYGRRAAEGCDLYVEALAGARKRGLLHAYTRTAATGMLARMAVAALEETGDARYRGVAERSARVLEKLDAPWPRGLAESVRGGVAASLGEREATERHLSAAAPLLGEAGLTLQRALALRGRGRIVGGDEGRALIEEAEGYLSAHPVDLPSAGRLLLPGIALD